MTKVGTFFGINKSTTTNHIKFIRLPRQSSLKSTLRWFLNHSNDRYLKQKIYQKITINYLNSYINLSQQIYLSHNYKLFKTFILQPVPHRAPVVKTGRKYRVNLNKKQNSEQRHVLYHEQNLKTDSSRKHAYLHKKIILSCEPMSFTTNLFSYVENMQLFRQSTCSSWCFLKSACSRLLLKPGSLSYPSPSMGFKIP